MTTDVTGGNLKKSVEDSYYCDTDKETNLSRSRSNPRGNEIL